MNEMGKSSASIGRDSTVFAVVSALSAICLLLKIAGAVTMLLGDHSALAPIVPEASDPFPPPGILPIAEIVLAFASLSLLALTAVFWLSWLVASSRFARRAGAKNMRFHPAMAAIWHFVPVMGYVMPLLVLCELEAATRVPAGWESVRTSLLAANTWLVGKLSAIFFLLTMYLSSAAETASEYVRGLVLTSAASVCVLLALLIANLFVRHMRRLQNELVQASAASADEGIAGSVPRHWSKLRK